MRTLFEIVKLSADYLASKGVQDARREAEWAIADVLQIPRIQLYLDFDRPLNGEEVEMLRHVIARRGEGEPLAYIRGKCEFYGCILKVTRDVLIPRSETEILVDRVAKTLREVSVNGKRLLDLCTGSGCIGLALKKHFPELSVYLSDLSEKALLIAKENAGLNQLSVHFLHSDLFTALQGKKFHFIVCNPPYIAEQEHKALEKEVHFEPPLALVGGSSGLEFYERLANELPSHLASQGAVWLEIGASQGASILSLFSNKCWKKRELLKDWAGHDRFISLEIE